MDKKRFVIALAGNPNSGKTTIFNSLTGARQKVGNWAGVTVEKKEGLVQRRGYEIQLVDLPGTYSLTPFSIEEIIARDFIIDESPDVVISIIDASNLERSLYLATQVRELDCRVIFALNMADLARSQGMTIDADKLSRLLDVTVAFTVGNKNEGVETLLDLAIDLAESGKVTVPERRVKYNRDVETAIARIREKIEQQGPPIYNSRWLAIKLLENDKIVRRRVTDACGEKSTAILETVDACRAHLVDIFDDDPEIVMTDERYGFIAGLVKEVVTVTQKARVDISRNIDLVLTNRYLGFPIFIFFIWLMFQMTFTLGAYPMGWIEGGFSLLTAGVDRLMADGLLKDMIIDGALAGVGSVAVFLPNILILFFCIALFEDTGYMARAAFLMDRIMHLIGLHGKSFIPMLMGFGCSVPAIMATRTLESRKDRILTILITPFMSCSARLPVYIVLAGTFFPAHAGTVIFLIYLLGIAAAIGTGRLFRTTLLKGADAPFVMELPPYRMPMARGLMIHMWDRAKMFIKKMGTYIFLGSIIVWALSAFPGNVTYSVDYDHQIRAVEASFAERAAAVDDGQAAAALLAEKDQAVADILAAKHRERSEKVYMGRIGRFIAPVFEPVGIDWRGSVALLTGFVAKEIVVSSMGVLYAVADQDIQALGKALRASGMTPLSALSMMVFVLLYIPCIATVTTIVREASWKWSVFNVVYTTGVAWCAAFVIFNAGRMAGIG
ncbi:MAG: ferrous iron transport protein B [Thermodesulfobacteriota bacterium]